MKRFARRAALAVTAVGAILSLGLATTTVVHAVATSVESGRIEPYGSPVAVDGKHMNVVVAGEGPDIVLLPGFGTASPRSTSRPSCRSSPSIIA